MAKRKAKSQGIVSELEQAGFLVREESGVGRNATVKTSIKLPRVLWREASVRAIDEGCDLQDVVKAALELYLKGKRQAQGGLR
jgi:hypothetical protein